MHAERLKLWTEFNTCWLTVLQTQKEVTEAGARQSAHSVMDHDQLEGMGKDLIRLCDVMEKHGLVDYQMGVWEEEIINRKAQNKRILIPTANHISTRPMPRRVRRKHPRQSTRSSRPTTIISLDFPFLFLYSRLHLGAGSAQIYRAASSLQIGGCSPRKNFLLT
jgi:hypothetical protein